MNPTLFERYEPFLLKNLKAHRNEMSEVGWMNGYYIIYSIGRAFSKGGQYPDSPIEMYRDLSPEETEEVYEFTDADRFGAWATNFNKAKALPEKDESSDNQKALPEKDPLNIEESAMSTTSTEE